MKENETAHDLSGRVAVISGAASGMGAATAVALADAGARLILGDINEEGLEDCAVLLRKRGHDPITAFCNVTQQSDLGALIALAVAKGGRLDVMANIAGVIHDDLVVDTSAADLDRVLDINLKGVFYGCQAAARVMADQGRGSIINMASSGGFTAIPKLSAYSMSKAGVVALTRVLAAELGPSGVRVNAIAPGFVEGGMTTRHVRRPDGSIDDAKMARVIEKARARTPLRITGKPEDIAQSALFLASDASRYMTGQVLHLGGGAYMP